MRRPFLFGGANNDPVCPGCGEQVRAGHENTKSCKERQKIRMLNEMGLESCGPSSRLLKEIGVPVVYYENNGRREPYAPTWASRLSQLPWPTKRWKRAGLERALREKSAREEALALLALGSQEERVVSALCAHMTRAKLVP